MANPVRSQVAMVGMIPALKRNKAINAATPIIASGHSRPPCTPLGNNTCQAKNTARLRITPTTAAVIPVKGAVNCGCR